MQTAVIVGGGFGGVRAALDLAKNKNLEIVLISKNPNFEYYPGLHKLVGVSEHAVYEIPLATIFKSKKNVRVIIGEATSLDPVNKTVAVGAETLSAQYLVIAVGSQTAYFGIPGLAEQSFGFKSVAEAKRLRSHVEQAFRNHAHSEKTEQVTGLNFVVAGAGPNGVDLAGELACFGRKLAARYKLPASLMTIDLIETGPRVLQMLPEAVSEHVERRLRELGINIFCNRDLKNEDNLAIELADMKIKSKTLIWTAGITTNEWVKKISGFAFGKKDRVVVDEYLQAKGFPGVYIIGDAADTPYSGLAQTAISDAEYAARAIAAQSRGKQPKPYIPHPNAFNIGTGPRWSVMLVGTFVMYGLVPYLVRTLIDIRFFLSILPAGEVWKLYAQ